MIKVIYHVMFTCLVLYHFSCVIFKFIRHISHLIYHVIYHVMYHVVYHFMFRVIFLIV